MELIIVIILLGVMGWLIKSTFFTKDNAPSKNTHQQPTTRSVTQPRSTPPSATRQTPPTTPNTIPQFTITVETSQSTSYFSESERSQKPKGKPGIWYGPDQSIRVQGHDIVGGMVYVGEMLLDISGYDNDSALINPKLKVTPAEPWEGADEMGYWPKYAQISPRCRGAYLKWLAGGRSEPEAYIGYVFLFFYGLERRLFVDGQKGEGSANERLEIVEEVLRLLKIYGHNRSFKGYASNLLAMEWVLYQHNKPVPQYIDFDDRYCAEPFQILLAKHVASGKPLPSNAVIQWMKLRPEFSLRTPARRCPTEFRRLFAHRYKEKYGDGLLIKPNKTPLKLEYHAASSSIRGDLQLKIPDLPNPFVLTAPLKKLSTLADDCTVELEPYSRLLGRKNTNPDSLAANALLPKELLMKSYFPTQS